MNDEDKTLWMGDLAPYMDGNFIGEAFLKMGEEVETVKIVNDKYTGQPAGYCFVTFVSAEGARRAMLSLNGKVVPDSRPPTTFKLSYAFNPHNPSAEYNLVVSNLPNEVDDAQLYTLFGKKYYSCRGAKVFRNPDGSSRGVGLVRFADETEQQQALVEMNRWPLFGRPIHLRISYPKSSMTPRAGMTVHHGRAGFGPASYNPTAYYSQYKDFYNSSQWQMYDYYQQPHSAVVAAGAPIIQSGGSYGGHRRSSRGSHHQSAPLAQVDNAAAALANDMEPEEPTEDVGEVELENERLMEQSEDLYKVMEASNWFFIPNASFSENDLVKRHLNM